jgi:hypothetical protein
MSTISRKQATAAARMVPRAEAKTDLKKSFMVGGGDLSRAVT